MPLNLPDILDSLQKTWKNQEDKTNTKSNQTLLSMKDNNIIKIIEKNKFQKHLTEKSRLSTNKK